VIKSSKITLHGAISEQRILMCLVFYYCYYH